MGFVWAISTGSYNIIWLQIASKHKLPLNSLINHAQSSWSKWMLNLMMRNSNPLTNHFPSKCIRISFFIKFQNQTFHRKATNYFIFSRAIANWSSRDSWRFTLSYTILWGWRNVLDTINLEHIRITCVALQFASPHSSLWRDR